MQKMSLRVGKRMKGSKSDKKELLRKLSSWREERKRESQRQLANLISSCGGGSVNQGIVDLAEEVCDLQAKLSAVTGTQFNRKFFGLSFGLKNGLRFHFDSATCLNYPFLSVFLV